MTTLCGDQAYELFKDNRKKIVGNFIFAITLSKYLITLLLSLNVDEFRFQTHILSVKRFKDQSPPSR